jgi:hypothetical protein
MDAPLRNCRVRGPAVLLASATAISLTALAPGLGPAVAQPVTETTVSPTVAIVPTTQAVPTVATAVPQAPVATAPPVIQQPVAPPVLQEPVAPLPTTQAPVVTEAPQIVTTTAPIPTPSAVVTTTAAPVPTPSAIVTTSAALAPVTTAGTSVSVTTSASAGSSAMTTSGSRGVTTSVNPGLTTSVSPGLTTSASPAVTTGATPRVTTSGAPAVTTSGSPAVTTNGGTTSPNAGFAPAPSTGAGGSPGSSSAGSSNAGSSGGGPPALGPNLQAAKVEEPKRVDAPTQDVEIAKASVPVQQNPAPAPQADITRLKDILIIAPNAQINVVNPANPPVVQAGATDWSRRVLQFQPAWVQYDPYFRPIILNPFRDPLQLVYNLDGVARMLTIPALASALIEAPILGAYNFTALVLNAIGIPTSVAVGNFMGGGYDPGPGLPPPPPPPAVTRYDDIPVVVKYTNATYKPFRVQKIVDVGADPRVGETKVLLDGVTPAWGEWKQTETGERAFEVHKTQQFPGMEDPQEGPLPGGYQLELLSDAKPTGLSGKDVVLIVAAAIVATLGLGAIGLWLFLGRRRRPLH